MNRERTCHPRTTAVGVLAVTLLMVAIAACSAGSDETAAPSTTKPPATTKVPPSSTTAPDPTVPVGAPTGPLTGLVVPSLVAFRPALAVKVDNLDIRGETARPQAGIADADIVFEEIVEGGITRLVAVFQSAIPERVGPVRSARTTDPKLLAQFNRPMFSWSGGNGTVAGAVRGSGEVRDYGWDAYPSAYGRDRSRRGPHDLFVTPGLLYDQAPQDAGPPPAVFTYRETGEALLPTAEPTRGVRLDFGSGTASPDVMFEYDPNVDGWRRTQNGTTHTDDKDTIIAPTNVVVLFTDYVRSPADPISPEAVSTGSGQAWVFSKGKVVGGTWERAATTDRYILKDAQGSEIKLTRGRTWVELPKPGGGELLN